MKILIFGATGMLGNTLVKYLISKNNLDVEFTVRNKSRQKLCKEIFNKDARYFVDANEPSSILEAIENFKPNFCINCLGIIKQKEEAKNYIKSIQINSLIPHLIADYCKRYNSQLIHISTDCIFSGKKGNYLDTDAPDPIDLYGRSKLLGEVSNSNATTIRTSIIGPEISSKNGLFEWFRNQEGLIYGYKNAWFSGFTTIELSIIIYKLIIKGKIKNDIYNLSSHPINKYELLRLINKVYGLNKEIIEDDSVEIDRTLNCDKFSRETGFIKDKWENMIIRMRDFD